MAVITRTFTGPQNIRDLGVVYNPLTISGVPDYATITKMTVTLNMTHPSTGHLHVALSDPDGNIVTLSSLLGGEGDNFTNTVFDDSATFSITSASPPFTGAFKSEFPLSSLYPGTINGDWGVTVHDFFTGSVGTFNSWSISITYPEAPTKVALNGALSSITEGVTTSARIKVADIAVTDDGEGANALSVTGADSAFFEIVDGVLYLKAGTVLDFEKKASYAVAVQANDPAVGGPVDAISPVHTIYVGNLTTETLTGTPLADTLIGSSDIDSIFGLAGADTLNGGANHDLLVGGPGPDTMTGGPGEDKFDFDLKTDFRKEARHVRSDHRLRTGDRWDRSFRHRREERSRDPGVQVHRDQGVSRQARRASLRQGGPAGYLQRHYRYHRGH